MSGPTVGEVWTASQYVAELRRRRDEARAALVDASRDGASWEEERQRERALVYEECAALAEMTADARARGPVLDTLAVLSETVVVDERFKPQWCQHAMSEVCGTWVERQARRAGWERCSLVTRFCPPVHRTPECTS